MAAEHGTSSRYAQGCRCEECRAAHAAAARNRDVVVRDTYNLAVGAIRKTLEAIEAYDEDPDANAGDVLEVIRALSQDTLGVLDRLRRQKENR